MSAIRLRLGAWALGLGLGGFMATANAVTQIPQPLTLDAALDWAGEYNPTLRAAKIRVEQLTGERRVVVVRRIDLGQLPGSRHALA